MLTDERRQVIVSSLSVHGSISVADLARIVRVSEATIRRDLVALERAGLLTRRRGGARASVASIDEPAYSEKRVIAISEKQLIARTAAGQIEDGDAIFLGPGTTTHALAEMLVRRRLMVATTSLLVATTLADASDVEVYMIGGVLRGSIRSTVGGDAESQIARLRLRTSFISGNGLTARCGLTTPNFHTASADRAAVAVADRVTVLLDHTKLGVDSTVQTVPLSQIDLLVTDSCNPRSEINSLTETGLEVLIAPDRRP
ncbi:MAG: DeoR/GlpR family DNA-binding transcription regulator [Brevibacterium aurantiacum]